MTKSGSNTLHGSAALFVIPDSFNSSNVEGVAANQRTDIQPDLTLGGPIVRDKIWFFGAYRRIQEDQTLNNAPVPARAARQPGLRQGHDPDQRRLIASRARSSTTRRAAKNAVIRSSATGGNVGDRRACRARRRSSSTPSAFGDLVTGGPLVGVNYTWVVSADAAVPVRRQLDGQQAAERRAVDGTSTSRR